MASGDAVQQIKERLSVVDVVSSYVELHQAGKNFKGKSPFTNEKTPSFYVSPDRGMYYCFSSSQGGDIFTFVQEMEGVDFKGALKILADKAGVELVPEDPKRRTERDRQYDVLEEATKFFEDCFTKETEARKYLEKRGVKPETRAKWRIGYAPGPPHHSWREMKSALEEKKYSKQELLKAGLIKGMDTGKEPYDLFRDRVMFPIFDTNGHVVAYSGRILSVDSEAPKYVNSPETELFNKSEILYGYDKAKQGIRTFDFSLIVEGQFDVVLAHQSGYTNTVAVSGTALTEHHVMLLQRLSNRVVLALDADRAGIAAVKRAADVMLSRGIDVKVAKMPEGKDPADIVHDNASDFKHIIGKASHVIEYLLDVLQTEGKDERTFKLKAREEILPYVAKIPNRIDQEHFENIIAQRLKTTKDAIHFEVERIIELQKNTPNGNQSTKESKKTVVDNTHTVVEKSIRKKDLLQYLAVMNDILPKTQSGIIEEIFKEITDTTCTEARSALDASVLSKLTFTLESQISQMPPKQLYEDLADKLTELSAIIKKEHLKELKAVLQEAELKSDEAVISDTIQRISALQIDLHKQYTQDLFRD